MNGVLDRELAAALQRLADALEGIERDRAKIVLIRQEAG